MVSDLLIKKFVKNYSDVKNKKVRERYGYLGGIIGILANILLFGIKFTVGTLVNSIAVTADAFNNLSDVGSSLVTIFGFKLSNKPADKEHPFGHGRIEYISGLIVAFLVLLIGFEFIKSSFERIKNPTPVEFSVIPFVLLLVSILLKIWLSRFYKNIGNKINSSALKASGVDALSDVVSSGVVVLSLFISRFTSLPIDGYIGMVVSAVILYAGYNLIKDTLDPLLGAAPDKELVEDIQRMILDYDHIDGAHDLLVHNYGPGRIIASIHAEVPSNISVVKIHEIIDRAEKEISAALDIYLVIHMDPVTTDDEEILAAREELTDALKAIPIVKSFHDFRVVGEGEKKNLIFDVVIDADHTLTKAEELDLQKNINVQLKKFHPEHNAIITVDKDYLGV
ncbi:cation diffusion facilitator family transporter [Clostridium sp. A1-XYC3]|uniref:Cation diffusion facilitator family transporter n=1 Tax=Clostridium tanneri TaxID=3037988 RepID=A0ABU4JW09_9CLOT|nr:cation diffusion facilitator family transporter [Clostridium sp. A1-XYC3]MDW8802118.1 cation diffusion facilitator family transporter [Clostridium sp. A1-XYC3]